MKKLTTSILCLLFALSACRSAAGLSGPVTATAETVGTSATGTPALPAGTSTVTPTPALSGNTPTAEPSLGPSLQATGASFPVRAVAAGSTFACALTPGGAVACWGDNSSGLLGNGEMIRNSPAIYVSGLESGVADVQVGYRFACVLTTSASVRCWGDNRMGQLGNGSTVSSPIPVDVSGLGSGVLAITVAGTYACALTGGRGVKCWGENIRGQLGNGATYSSAIPVDVSGLDSDVLAVSAQGDHACALTGGGRVVCWGTNYYTELGIWKEISSNTPVDVTGLPNDIRAIAVGGSHACALTGSGSVKCWGRNDAGQLGNGATVDTNMPVEVAGLAGAVTTLRAGYAHTCILTESGRAQCWGSNRGGQLGNGTTTDSALPVDVSGLGAGVSALSAVGDDTCAVVDGDARCWGSNYSGQLGDGTTSPSLVPVYVNRPLSAPVPQQVYNPSLETDKNANCRKGPSVAYDIITSLPAGLRLEIVGRVDRAGFWNGPIWWLVRIPQSTEKCWISGATGVASDVTALVAIVEAMPLPNVPAGFSISSICPEKKATRVVKLAWVDLAGETGYSLYRNGELIATLPADATSFEDQARVDTFYRYQLGTFNEYGVSERVTEWIDACK